MSLPLAFRYFISHFCPYNYIYVNSLIPHLSEWDLLCTVLNTCTWRVSNRQVGRNEQYPLEHPPPATGRRLGWQRLPNVVIPIAIVIPYYSK